MAIEPEQLDIFYHLIVVQLQVLFQGSNAVLGQKWMLELHIITAVHRIQVYIFKVFRVRTFGSCIRLSKGRGIKKGAQTIARHGLRRIAAKA